jgi:hypothetical protein
MDWKHLEVWKDEIDLKKCVRRLFEILDVKEVSNNDREFSPVYISSCRVKTSHELGFLLTKMRELSEYKKDETSTK